MNLQFNMFSSFRSNRQFCRSVFISKMILLTVTLIGCLWLRISYHQSQPFENRHFYSRYYTPVLFFMAGKGMTSPEGAFEVKGKNTQSENSINNFLNLKQKNISLDSIKKFIDENPTVSYTRPVLLHTLGFYVTALIWGLFGISWMSLFNFYSVMSTLACLSVFLTARKICNSFWGGFFSALVYIFAIPEVFGSAWSIRDAVPVWFFSFAAWFLFCGIDSFKNKWLNYISYYLLGVISLLGCGWRYDCLMFFPIIALALVVMLIIRSIRQNSKKMNVVICLVLFLAGSFSMKFCIDSIQSPSLTPWGFMHIAQYGEETRCRLGRYENNFQNQFNDTVTHLQAKYYAKKNFPDSKFGWMKGVYGKSCLKLYLLALEHNAYVWLASYPSYFFDDFLRSDALAKNVASFGQSPGANWSYAWAFCVYLAVLGGLFFLFVGIWRTGVLFFLGFFFYYSFVYWSVLPMLKHIMVVSVPISILAGLSIYSLLAVFIDKKFQYKVLMKLRDKKNWKLIFLYLILFFSSYFIVLFSTNVYCKEVRNIYFKKAISLSQVAVDASQQIVLNPNIFSVNLTNISSPVGLLIDFETLGEQGFAKVRHIHKKSSIGSSEYIYNISKNVQRHTLFTTCYPMGEEYRVTCIFPENAQIANIRFVSLEEWDGMFYSAVFNSSQVSPGPAFLKHYKGPVFRSMQIVNELGLEEHEINRLISTDRVIDYLIK